LNRSRFLWLAAAVACLSGWDQGEPPQSLLLRDGSSVELSPSGNLLRRRYGATIDEDYAALKRLADGRRAEMKKNGETPVEWKVALTVVERLLIDRTPTGAAAGEPVRTEVAMTPEEALYCLRVFLRWTEAVHVLTGGEVEVQYTVRFLDRPIHETFQNTFFFVPLQGMPEFAIESGSVDSVLAYFKPGPVPTSMYGGTHPGDRGPGGAASSGLALIPARETSERSFVDTTMHEWLHQIEWALSSLLGYRGLPGTHELLELGYPPQTDAYWAHRDLMRFVVAPGMWRKLSIRKATARTDPSGGLREWLVLGPFENADDQALHREVFPEASVMPDVGEILSDHEWHVASSTAGYTDLKAILAPPGPALAYAHAYVFSSEETPAFLALGTDDGVKVYHNGLLVLDDHTHRAARKDASMVKVVLQKGWNRLLLKVDQGVGAWGFYARYLDLSLRPMPDLRYAARRPSEEIVTQGKAYEKASYALKYFSFDQVKDDPWFKLPRMDAERLSEVLGLTGIEIHSAGRQTLLAIPAGSANITSPVVVTPDPSNERLDNQLTWDRESCLHVRYRDRTGEERDLIGLRPDVADVFLQEFRSLDPAPDARAPADSIIGYVLEGSKPLLLLETALPEAPRTELDLLASRSDLAELFATVETARIHRGRDFAVRFDLRNRGELSAAAVSFSLQPLVNGVVVVGDGMEVKGLAPAQSVSTTFHLKATPDAPCGPLLLRARAELHPVDGKPEVVEKLVSSRIDDPIQVRAALRQAREGGVPVVASRDAVLDVSLDSRIPAAVSGTLRLGLPEGWALPAGEVADGTDGLELPGRSFQLDPDGSTSLALPVRIPEEVADGTFQIHATAELPGTEWPPSTAAALLHVATRPTLSVQDFESELAPFSDPLGNGINGSGAYRVSAETEHPLSGAVSARIDDQGGAHFGHVRVFGAATKGASPGLVYNTKDFPILEFLLRTESHEPTALLITVDGEVCCAMVTGEYEEQWERRVLLPRVPFQPGPEPVRVVYALDDALDRMLGRKEHYVTRIDFGDPRAFVSNQWFGPDVKTYWFDDVTIRR
jgi:hypothetical protein